MTASTPTGRLAYRSWALVSGGTGLSGLVVYLTIITGEGDNAFWEIFPWAVLMAIPTVVALVAAFVPHPRTARALLLVSASVFGLVGLVAALTIGPLFLLAGLFAVLAIARFRRASPSFPRR
ncbi:MAG: hypothetical protein PVG83_13175 [Acidimicrobiia bacterium]|jgi:hypothetical protein